MGPNPLSRAPNGKQIKDLDDQKKLELYQDMFRPPGVVRLNDEKQQANRNAQG